MEILKELLPGAFLLQPKRFEDSRGSFVKTYQYGLCQTLGVDLDIREEFYSVSHKNVIRGMHFQLPPHEHDKLVYCTHGAVMDVLLDLRTGPTYGHVVSVQISGENAHIVFIPKGIAHGFLALTDEALMVYKTNSEHMPSLDSGIRWDSFGFDWPCLSPTLSDRDLQHSCFDQLLTPF